ncbi:MAG TPA: hypothetical protein VN325_23445 [Steroidobacteraceae bacterium]|nr:hypothetical protein [Steroidobacteraceae bacterium]
MPSMIQGKKVRDAKSKLMINIVKRDVDNAAKMDPGNCAISRAVKRCAHAHQVIVHRSRTYVQMNQGSDWLRYETPESAARELISFDRGAGFQEDNYTLRPVRPSAREGMLKDRKRDRGAYTGKKRTPHHVLKGVRASIKSGI